MKKANDFVFLNFQVRILLHSVEYHLLQYVDLNFITPMTSKEIVHQRIITDNHLNLIVVLYLDVVSIPFE